jgi:hypothetical protein
LCSSADAQQHRDVSTYFVQQCTIVYPLSIRNWAMLLPSACDLHRLFRPQASYGRVILSGFTSASNSSPVRYPSFSAASRRLECSTCAVCAICAALS